MVVERHSHAPCYHHIWRYLMSSDKTDIIIGRCLFLAGQGYAGSMMWMDPNCHEWCRCSHGSLYKFKDIRLIDLDVAIWRPLELGHSQFQIRNLFQGSFSRYPDMFPWFCNMLETILHQLLYVVVLFLLPRWTPNLDSCEWVDSMEQLQTWVFYPGTMVF